MAGVTGNGTPQRRVVKAEPAPTTPDPIEIAMETEAKDVSPDSPARALLIDQGQLIGADLKLRGWQIASERAGFALKVLTGLAGLAAAGALAAWPMAASGQSTSILPDTGSIRALGTTATQMGTFVTIDGGTRAGNNLFHSFAQFNLGAGDTARWVRAAGDGGSVANVISRVTGGQTSLISGTLDSTGLPNASFFLINPAGIVFGAGARVNVPAAAYFSTASELRFADTARFAVSAPNGSTLSMASPRSFGFVGGEAGIEVNGVDGTFAPPSVTLGLTARAIRVSQSSFALNGLDLVAVGGGAIGLRGSQIVVSPNGVNAGSLRVSGGSVSVDGTSLVSDTATAATGGHIEVSADSLRLTGGSQFVVSSRAGGASGQIDVSAGSIDGDNALLSSFTSASGAGGRISVSADEVNLRSVTLASNALGAGAGGDIEVQADRLSGDKAYFVSQAAGSARSGSVTIDATDISLFDSIAFSGVTGVGRPGGVSIFGDEILLSGGAFGSIPGTQGDSGDLMVDASSYLEITGAILSVSTNSDSAAGAVFLRSPEMQVRDTFINSTALGSGAAGTVSLLGDHLAITNSQLVAESRGIFTGRLGSVRLLATRNIELDGTLVSSSAFGVAKGGVVLIEGRDVRLDKSRVLSETFGAGDAGSVSINADRLLMQFGSISSNTYGAGRAGLVSLVARGIVLANSAALTSDTFGAGDGVGVSVRASEIVVADNASITSETSGGTGNAGAILIVSDTLKVTNGFISSDTEGKGKAGEVRIRTGTLIVTNPDGAGGYISSDSLGDGDAGNVIIDAKSVTVSNTGFISSTALEGGDAGSVVITAETLVLDGGTISSAADLGSRGGSGDLRLQARDFTVRNGGRITTASFSAAVAGQVEITAGTLTINGDGALISSENFSGGPAAGGPSGRVGDAGSVGITAGSLTVSNGGRITTNSFAGAAGQIRVTIDRPGLLVLKGSLAPGVIQTSSGAGTGGEITISDPLAIISNGGSILALGQQRGANVTLQSRYFINSSDRSNTVAVDGDFRLETGIYDVSSGTVTRDLSVLDASKILRGQCPAARSSGAVSQLITRPVGPYVRSAEFSTSVSRRVTPAGVCQ